jgi:hypothetical protein
MASGIAGIYILGVFTVGVPKGVPRVVPGFVPGHGTLSGTPVDGTSKKAVLRSKKRSSERSSERSKLSSVLVSHNTNEKKNFHPTSVRRPFSSVPSVDRIYSLPHVILHRVAAANISPASLRFPLPHRRLHLHDPRYSCIAARISTILATPASPPAYPRSPQLACISTLRNAPMGRRPTKKKIFLTSIDNAKRDIIYSKAARAVAREQVKAVHELASATAAALGFSDSDSASDSSSSESDSESDEEFLDFLDDLSEIVMDKRYLAPRKRIRKTTSGLDMVLRVRTLLRLRMWVVGCILIRL